MREPFLLRLPANQTHRHRGAVGGSAPPVGTNTTVARDGALELRPSSLKPLVTLF